MYCCILQKTVHRYKMMRYKKEGHEKGIILAMLLLSACIIQNAKTQMNQYVKIQNTLSYRTAAQYIQGKDEETSPIPVEENGEKKQVALTFDDGPSSYTEELSKGLKERGVQATFFLLGENVEKQKEAVKQLYEDGHLLGNHSYHHVQLTKLKDKEACQEILRTNNEIFKLTGYYPVYARPPYGEWNTGLDLCVEMIPVFWDVDSLDWKLQNTDKIVQRVLSQTEEGDIILMHDGYQTSVDAAFRIVDKLLEEGYTFVTADRMLED